MVKNPEMSWLILNECSSWHIDARYYRKSSVMADGVDVDAFGDTCRSVWSCIRNGKW